MSVESDEKQDSAIVEKAVASLVEHFDTVQIFVTRHEMGEKDGTVRLNSGRGNWFARYGQCHEWLVREDEQSRINARKLNEDG